MKHCSFAKPPDHMLKDRLTQAHSTNVWVPTTVVPILAEGTPEAVCGWGALLGCAGTPATMLSPILFETGVEKGCVIFGTEVQRGGATTVAFSQIPLVFACV